MEYADFILELRTLRDEAASLRDLPETHQHPAFRKWRHQVTALISAIEDHEYSIDCAIASRLFQGASAGPLSRAEQIDSYNLDLQDTINEIETSIDHFDKYGDPKVQKAPEKPREQKQELEWPQKISLSWLFTHAPIDLWLKFVGALAAAFVFGIAFAQTELYSKLGDVWKARSAVEAPVSKEPNSTVDSGARKDNARGSP